MMRMLVISIVLFSSPFSFGNEKILAVGESKTFPIRTQGPVTIGDGKILKATESSGQIIAIAKSPGETSIAIGLEHYTVRVVQPAAKITFQKIQKLLSKKRGLTAKFSQSGKIEILGTLLRLRDWIELADIIESGDFYFTFRAKIHPSIEDKTESYLKSLLEKAGIGSNSLTLYPYPKMQFNESLKTKEQSIKSTLGPLGLEFDFTHLKLTASPSIRLELVLAEVDKTFNQELGIQWGDTGTYKAEVLNSISWDALTVQLKALESSGSGQILAKPQILSRSGEKAEFHAGGEIPIRIAGWGNQNVSWKKHGIILNFHPLADHFGNMKLSIEVEVSIPNLSQTVGQLPTFETNRVKSHFDINGKKTVVLSGLVRNTKSNFQEGLPFLAKIPILGRLFGSKRFQSRETELLIFVTPEVIDLNRNDNSKPTLPKGLAIQ